MHCVLETLINCTVIFALGCCNTVNWGKDVKSHSLNSIGLALINVQGLLENVNSVI